MNNDAENQIGRLTGLIVVTATAVAVAVLVTAGGGWRNEPGGKDETKRKIPPTPVAVEELQRERIAITDSYSGMIRPWERYSLGFEVAGRVASDARQSGRMPDEGDLVAAGDVLARLDDESFRLQLAEAAAQMKEADARLPDVEARLKQAEQDLARSERLRFPQPRLVVSKRLVDPGESVTPHQVVMEVIQVDTVLLVVGVPEAYIGDVRRGQKVRVELLARNRYGRARRSREGWVYRVAEAADGTTGLFEVEIGVDNADGAWKPGLIAMAHIVLEEIEGYRIAAANTMRLKYDAALEDKRLAKDKKLLARLKDDREEVLFVYTVDADGKARRHVLTDFVEQGPDVVVRDRTLPADCRRIVCQGQHRLVAGREVRVVNGQRPGGKKPSPAVRTPASVAESKSQHGRGS